MANNYIKGEVNPRTWTNGGSAVSSGDPVVIGAMLCIALGDIAGGATGEVATTGVFELAKADAAVIAQGEFVTWDSSASNFDDASATPATGDVTLGAFADEGKGATTGETIRVELVGHPGTLA